MVGFLRAQPAAAYVLAVVGVALVTAAHALLTPVTVITPFLLFHAAVPLIAWFCGKGPGYLAAVLSGLAVNYLFLHQVIGFSLGLGPLLATGIFIAVHLMMTTLISVLRRTEESLVTAQRLAERTSERIRRLQAVATVLSGAVTEEEIGRRVVEEGLRAMGAKTGTLAMIRDGVLVVIADRGFQPGVVETWRRISLDSVTPAALAARTGEAVWLESRQEYVARFPKFAETPGSAELQAQWCVPLEVDGRPLGSLGFGFDQPRKFDEEERRFLQTLGRQCAQALDRARLFRTAQAARAEAELQRQRLYTLFLQAPAIVEIMRGPDHRYEFINERAASLSSSRVVVGRKFREAYPELRERAALLDQVFASGESVTLPELATVLDWGNGVEEKVLSTVLQPYKDAFGEVEGVMTFAFDVTEQVRTRRLLQQAVIDKEESLALLDTLMGTAPVGMAYVDRSMRFLRVNNALAAMNGLPAAKHLNRTIAEVLPRLAAEVEPYYRKALAGEATTDVELSGQSQASSGLTRHWLVSYYPIRRGSEVIGAGVVVLDFTDRKRAEESSRFMSEASELLTSSLDYEMTLANLARLTVPRLADWCAIDMVEGESTRLIAVAHGDPSKADLVRLMRELYPPDPKEPRGIHNVLRTGESEFYAEVTEERMRRSAHNEDHLRMAKEVGLTSAMLVSIPGRSAPLGVISLCTSSPSRRFQPSDLAFAEELARRAGLAVENAQLLKQLQEAVRLRDDFLSVAGHELKTPLTTLQLNVETLQRNLREPKEAASGVRAEKGLATVRRQVSRLTTLVGQLLDVSRIQAGRLSLDLEEVDLSQLVTELAGRLEDEATRAGSKLQVTTPGPAVGTWDRSRLEQIVLNLVSNALKYGRGKPVVVTVAKDDGHAALTVRDEGIGIGAEDQSRIFERFERAVSGRHYGGLGLGLWIVRQLVAAHGGSIRVDSAPGRGSTFTLELPLQPPPPAAQA